jgi:hypothetical protein
MSSPKETYFPEIAKEKESCEGCGKNIDVDTELFFNEDNGEVFCSTQCCEENWMNRLIGYH